MESACFHFFYALACENIIKLVSNVLSKIYHLNNPKVFIAKRRKKCDKTEANKNIYIFKCLCKNSGILHWLTAIIINCLYGKN